MKRIDPHERARFWIARAVEAEARVAYWTERGECDMTRGATRRAREWAKEANELASRWLDRSNDLALKQAA
jgi:hypothetical protein